MIKRALCIDFFLGGGGLKGGAKRKLYCIMDYNYSSFLIKVLGQKFNKDFFCLLSLGKCMQMESITLYNILFYM